MERRYHCTWCHIRWAIIVHCPQAHSLSEPKQPAHTAIRLWREYWTHHSNFLVQPQLCLYYQWQSLGLVFWTSNSLASSHHGYSTRGSLSPLALRHCHCKMPGTTNLSNSPSWGGVSRSQGDLLLCCCSLCRCRETCVEVQCGCCKNDGGQIGCFTGSLFAK